MNICSHDDSNFGMNIRILDDDVKVDVLQSFVAVLADTSGSMSKPYDSFIIIIFICALASLSISFLSHLFVSQIYGHQHCFESTRAVSGRL